MRNWKTWVIYCVSFIGFFLANALADLACGPEVDPYDYYVSFFHSNVHGEKDYKPFYYTSERFLYDDTDPASEAELNANEWADYLGEGVKQTDVLKAMYRLDKGTDMVVTAGYLTNDAKLPDSLANNTFLRALAANTNAVKYYRFAKSVEKIANIEYDRWDPKPVDSLALREAGATAFKYGEAEKDAFLKLRYYYQSQRLLHYGHAYEQAKAVYDRYIADAPSKSHVKGWAMALLGGEQRHLGGSVAAAYTFSRLFAQYPERRVQAYKNYMYMHVSTAQVLALAGSDDERAVINAMAGFGSPEMNMGPLQEVYRFDPTSPMVGVLLVREINKIEESQSDFAIRANKTGNYFYNGTQIIDSLDAKTATHIQKLKDFCERFATDKISPDANLGFVAAAYLAWMQGGTDDGSNLLKALYGVKLNDKLNDQKQIVQLLLTEQEIAQLNQVNEATMLPTLKWLQEKVKTEKKEAPNADAPHPFATTERNFYQHILAPAYLKQCDTVMAAIALDKSGDMTDFWQNYLRPAQVKTIIDMKLLPPVNPYLHFMTEGLAKHGLSELYELLGTTYLRKHDYPEAMAALRHVDAAALNAVSSNKADPFIELVNDYPKLYRYGQSKGYNKLQFAIAMNTLEQNIINDPANTASYCYKLGAGLYNTSHYGNGWYLISYNWSSTDFGRAKKYDYDDDYIKTSNAEKYFVKAAHLSKTQEFRGRCVFMAAKCRQKLATQPSWSAGADYEALEKAYMTQIRSSFYFEDLKKNYRKTAFYKKAVSECSYLKDYIRAK